MATSNQLVKALAPLRRTQAATIEQYTRELREKGLLPPTKRGFGGVPLSVEDGLHVLFAVLRGRPASAAEEAAEVASLVVKDYGGGLDAERMFAAVLEAFGLAPATTLLEFLSALVGKIADGTAGEWVSALDVTLSVSEYWPEASVRFPLSDRALEILGPACGETYRPLIMFDRKFTLEFVHPFHPLHSRHPGARTAEGNAAYRKAADWSDLLDLRADQVVTERTLQLLADVVLGKGGEVA